MATRPMNKFTKSVLEREQKDQPTSANLINTEPLALTQAKQEDSSFPVSEQSIAPMPQKKATEKNSAALKSKKAFENKAEFSDFSLDLFLTPGQGRQAKNKTFYLDTGVINAIKKAATDNQIPESKLVNDILKKILQV